jgi:biotin transporter BioY
MAILLAHNQPKTLRNIKRKSYIAQIVLLFLGVEMLFFSSFTNFNLPTATAHNWQRYTIREAHKLYLHLPLQWQLQLQNEFPVQLKPIISLDQDALHNMRTSPYVPQVPAAIFLGYILGWPLATICALIYVLLGIFGPAINIYPFACGSGASYYLQPGFGYLLGMIAATAGVGHISRGERTSLKQLLSLLAGLLCVHGIGLMYMLGICLYGTIYDTVGTQLNWAGWLLDEARNLSYYALPYDFIFSLALIGAGFPLRWLTNVLTSPDIASQSESRENLINFRPPMHLNFR